MIEAYVCLIISSLADGTIFNFDLPQSMAYSKWLIIQ